MRSTAGLSIHAVRQLLHASAYAHQTLTPESVVTKVQEFIQSQLGEDVVEFKKPSHTLGDVVGNSKLKKFIQTELLPRLRATGEKALPGAGVAGLRVSGAGGALAAPVEGGDLGHD